MASGHKQGTAVPTTKVISGGVAGAISVVVVWAVNAFELLPSDTQIPGEVASALTTIFAFAVSYFVPPRERDSVIKR